MTKLTQWWRLMTGASMAESAGYAKGWMEGFTAGVQTQIAASQGTGFVKGFIEGRASLRAEQVAVTEEQELTCLGD
jgi:hypothetical protein